MKLERRLGDENGLSNTTVDNVSFEIEDGKPQIYVDKVRLVIGQPYRMRGTLETYRGKLQIKLERIKALTATEQELESWVETIRWQREVLDKPWVLSLADRQRIDAELEAKRRADEKRSKRKRIWHAERAKKQAAADEEDACKQRELQAEFDDGALAGSEHISAPWD